MAGALNRPVRAAMAEDGFLPRILAARDGQVPVGSVILQGAIATVIVLVQPFQHIMHDVAARWIQIGTERGYHTQSELRMKAHAHLVREEYAEAKLALLIRDAR